MIKIIIFIISIVFSCTVNAEMKHSHKFFNATKPYPEIELTVEKDIMDGFNLRIVTRNFRFTPERVNKSNSQNEGHAHIYINGEKIRQYSPYFHLSRKFLHKNKNEIRVSLHANDHSHFVVDMEKIQKTIFVQK
jgi:hypothetical protein